jgi:hypothetical protein
MKRLILVLMTLSVLMVGTTTASADSWGFHYSSGENWNVRFHSDNDAERGWGFSWRDHFRDMHIRYHMEEVYDREWEQRFPDLHVYRWRDDHGFWHHGHMVRDALFFFNESDELVGFGYWDGDVFVHARADHKVYESHDSFYVSWRNR